jgi:hypothetical protein
MLELDECNPIGEAVMTGDNAKGRRSMDWKLEVVPVPVSDVDRAKRF